MAFMEKIPKWSIVSVSLMMVAVIGIVDKLTGDYSMLVFYLGPVFMTSWFVGRRCLYLTVFAAGVARGIANYPHDGFANLYYSLHYWNTIVDVFFLLLLGLLFSYLRKVLD